MKSLFSCFSKKKSKSKTSKNAKSDSNFDLILESKPNHCNDKILIDLEKIVENNVEKDTEIMILKEEEIKKEINSEKYRQELEERLRNVLGRIENVYSVLNNKKRMYTIVNVINDFTLLNETLLSNYISQSENLGEFYILQATFVCNLFNIQSELLDNIKNLKYSSISMLNKKFKDNVIEINILCSKGNENNELCRLIADSIMIFGWLCCYSNPSNFTLNVLDGTVMVATKLVNDPRYSKYSTWLKSWTSLMKAFHNVIVTHFEAALMWRLAGPVPMDILKCLIQCNYSNMKEEPISMPAKQKVVKTTAVNDISYETVTSLFDDLRSGKQKSKLRSIKKDEPETEKSLQICVDSNEPVVKTELTPTVPNKPQDPRPFILKDKTWLIRDQTGDPDIEITNKCKDNSVLISNCSDCSIQIDGTIDNISIENCSSINVITDQISSLFSVTDSLNVESQVLGSVVKAELRQVSKFRLFIPKECSENLVLVTVKCSDIDLYVSNVEGGGLELEDYDRYTVGNYCHSGLSAQGQLTHDIVLDAPHTMTDS